MDRSDPAYRGQADYNEILLRLYDPLVLGPISRYVWRFPIEKYGGFYPEHIRPNHLDIGQAPGTSWSTRASMKQGDDPRSIRTSFATSSAASDGWT
jgi:hypothetical protein